MGRVSPLRCAPIERTAYSRRSTPTGGLLRSAAAGTALEEGCESGPAEGLREERFAADLDHFGLDRVGACCFVEMAGYVAFEYPRDQVGEASLMKLPGKCLEKGGSGSLALGSFEQIDREQLGVVGFNGLSDGAAADEADDLAEVISDIDGEFEFEPLAPRGGAIGLIQSGEEGRGNDSGVG